MKDNVFLSESFVCACIIKIQTVSGNLSIMIHRDITGPPKDMSGKPASRSVG
jgi:hypothetical protein